MIELDSSLPELRVEKFVARSCSLEAMTELARHIDVALEPAHARKLADLAERTHVEEGQLAVSLLAGALDEADPGGTRLTEILDGIPGAWERAQVSIEQAKRGETVPLSEL